VRLHAEPLEERILLTLASQPNQPLPVGTNPVALQAGLIDSDNTTDLVVLNADGSLTVALNNGDNYWRNVRSINLNIGPANGLALGLLDADPFLDAAVQGPNGITLARGDGTGNFSVLGTLTPEPPGALAPAGGGRVQLATALLNNDTATDLVTVSPGTSEVLVFLGKGDGTFAAPQHYPSGGSGPVAVVVGDFVGDSLPDLAVGHQDGSVTFFQGLPGGTFLPRPDLTAHVPGAVTGLATGTFDASGATELAVSSTGGVSVLRNGHAAALTVPLGNGTFVQGLAGWTTTGPVNALGGFVQLNENTSGLLTELRQTFTVPAQATTVSFDLVALGLDDATPGSLPDAFEASLLDASGSAAVPAFGPGATAFFNANPGPTAGSGAAFRTAPGVTFDGRHVTVDISHLAVGSQATLSFDLVGNPPAAGSTASVDNVQVNRQPPAETFTATALTLPAGAAPAGVTAADVDGDGHTDLVVTDPVGGQLLVYNGDGAGNFALSTVGAGSAGQGPQAVATAPLTGGDGIADVAFTLPASNRVMSPIAFDTAPPTVQVLDPAPGQVRDQNVNQVTLRFSEPVRDAGPTGSHSASNPASYALVNTTTGQPVPLASAAYNPATLEVVLTPAAGSVPLPDASYRVTVKGADAANAIVDLAGNALNGGTDTTSTFTVDTAPPTATLQLSPNVLWSANHQLVSVHAQITVHDGVDPNPTVTLVSITSNEPDTSSDPGDLANDIQNAAYGSDDRDFSLRAEHLSTGTGRVYTVTYLVRDAAGNGRLLSGFVAVPLASTPGASSITANFNGTAIGAGNTLWFNSVLKPSGLGSNPVTIRFVSQSISFTANGQNYTLPVPDSAITYSPTATTATTTFDTATGSWVSTVPSSGLSGNQFLSALAYPVTVSLPGGIQNVTWSGQFLCDTAGVTLNWQWAAAVYRSFSTDYNALGVKPVDDTHASQYQNSDHAGTPENFKASYTGSGTDVIAGGTGGGASNYTGGYSGTGHATPAPSSQAVLTLLGNATPPGVSSLQTNLVSSVRNGSVAAGGTASGNLAAGEVDVYALQGTAGQRLFFDAQTGAGPALHWSLTDAAGNVLFTSDFADHDTLTLPATGTYYLTVDGRSGPGGPYQFAVDSVPAPVTTSTTIGAPVSGSLTVPGQQARYTFAGTAGQHVFFDVQNGASSPLAFTVLNPDGSTLLAASNQNQGNGLTLPATGTYTVVVGHGATLSATGAYQFEVWAVPADVPTNVTLNQSVSGAVTVPGQTVSYAFHAALGQRVLVHVTAGAGTVTLTLRDPSGNVVFSGASADQAVASLPSSGTYTLSASATGDSTVAFGFVVQDQTAAPTPTGTANNTPAGSFSTTGGSGRSVGPIDFSHLQDATGLGRLDYRGTTYNLTTHTLYASVQLTNTTPVLLAGPVVEVFDAFAPPVARLATADGTTPSGAAVPAGLPYMAFTTELGAGGLAAGASSTAIPLQFADPTDARFGFTTTLLAPANHPPAFTSTPVKQATVGTPYSYQATATDPDGDALTYQLLVGPLGMTVGAQSGLVQWTPTADEAGTQDVTLQVSDGRGGTDVQSFTIQFPTTALPPPANTPPIIVSTPENTNLVSGEPFTYPARALDPDGDTLHWSLAVGPTGMTIDPNSGVVSWPGASGGVTQWASSVLGFSSQFSGGSWAASQALGQPNTPNYGDNGTAWAPGPENGTHEFITLGYATPVHASGVTVVETDGNGFVTQIDLLDTNNVLHTVFSGADPSQPGAPVNFTVGFAPTPYLVQGVKIYTDTNHNLSTWEEIDAVALHSPTQVPVTVQVDDGHNNFDSQNFVLNVSDTTPGAIHGAKFNDLNANGVRDGIAPGSGPTNPGSAGTLTFSPISTTFNQPIGIDYYEPTNSVVVSVNYFGGQPRNFETILTDGSHVPFSNVSGFSDEVLIATVRSGNTGGFTVGDLFVGNGIDGQIVKITNGGNTVINPWVVLPGCCHGLFRGALWLDQTGVFGGDLIAVTDNGEVWRVNSAGVPTFLANVHAFLEGVTTVPNDPVRYGPLAGKIAATWEDGSRGGVYTVDPQGHTAFIDLGMNQLEDIRIIPPNQNFFGVNYGTSRILGVPSTQFTSVVGDLLLTQEFHGGGTTGLYRLFWDGTAIRVQPFDLGAGSPPVAQWEHVGFAPAAIDPLTPPVPAEPGLPGWTIYLDLNGDGRFEPGEPSAVTDAQGNYSFSDIAPGTYTVREVPQPGWMQTAPAAQSWTVTVTGAGLVSGVDFGNHSTADPSTNHPPVFSGTPPAVGAVNNLYEYAPTVTDPDGDTLAFSLATAPAGMAIDPVSGTILWTPTAAEVGPQAVTIVASDGRGGVTPLSFTVTVGTTPLNHPPIFVTTPVAMALAGAPYTYTAQALDPDGDPLTYFLTAAPAGMAIDPVSGAITWSPAAADAGDHSVTVRVKDGRGGFDMQTYTVTVGTGASGGAVGTVFNDLNDNGRRDVTSSTVDLYFTQYQGSNRVSKVSATYDGTTLTLGTPTTIAFNIGADGLVFGPDGNLYVGGQGNIVYQVNPTTGAIASVSAGGTNAFHIGLDPSGTKLWTGGIPGGLAEIPLRPFANGIAHPLQGDDTAVDTIAFDAAGNAYYTSSGGGGFGDFGRINLTTFTTTRVYSNLPAAHGMAYDSFTNDLILFGDNHITQIDPTTMAIVSERDFSGQGLGAFDQGTVDGSGRVYEADNDGHLIFVDYSHTGLVGAANDVVATPFLAPFLDDIAPVSGTGSSGNAQEPGLPNWTVYLDLNGNGQPDPGEPTSVTDANGRYAFSNLAPGVYTVREVPQAGWVWTAPANGSATVTVVGGQVVNGIDFGNQTTAAAGANHPPAFTSMAPNAAKVGQLFSYQATANDPDGDPITFDLVTKPAGMVVEPSSGLVVWVPTADESGPQQVVLRVTDARGASALQPFTLNVPSVAGGVISITSSPPGLATVGQAYGYAVTATAPAGQTPVFSVSSGPTGMGIDPNSGQLTWTPAAGDVGSHLVILRVTDAEGDVGFQSYNLQVRPASVAPTVTSTPVTTTAVGVAYHYQVTATDPTDGFTFSLPTGPATMTINPATGLVTWLPGTGDLGSHTIDVRVTNDRGLATDQTFPLTVTADTQAPSVSILQTTNLANPGDTITLQVLATDNVAVSSLTLTANNTPLTLDANGITTYTATVPGMVNLVATARDPSGNVGTGTANIRVFDPADTTPPVALITSPAYGDSVTYLTQVTGTVTDQNLEFYRLEYSPAGQNQWTQFASGTQQVTNGPLGTFDPTLLEDGSYDIRLTAQDIDGHITYSQIAVGVSGAAKIGTFHLEYTDLNVPLAGIPITIKRVYDTTQANEQGDFGFGWQMTVFNPNIRETVPVTTSGFFGASPFRTGTRVYLTNPSGTREGFTFDPTPEAALLGTLWHPRFVADPGVYDKLTVDDVPMSQRADGTFGLYLFGFAYNPDDYRLTTPDGTVFQYNQFTGLHTATDRNGNSITVTANGITSSLGQSIPFVRDAQGRITRITDPAGKTIVYQYDAAGNLIQVTDEAARTSTYQYLTSPAHYMSVAVDPLGHQAVGGSYDDQGRLVSTHDALGNTTGQTYDLTHFSEVYTDAFGKQTQLVYDARGNLVSSTDPLGHTTTATYDSNDNPTRVTDPLGHTTVLAYDAAGNVTSVTDALGGVSTYAYNSLNEPTLATDQLGHTTTWVYDARGNLVQYTNKNGASSYLTYDPQGRPVTYKDNNGFTTRYAYGDGTQPTLMTMADGSTRQFEYNWFGEPTRIVDEIDPEVNYTYDDVGRITAIYAPDGGVTTFTYDAQHVLSETDPLGHTTQYQYDAAGRRVRVIDPAGGITQYVYDGNNRLVSTTDPLGHTTTTNYRDDGLAQSTVDALGGITSYEYDAAGHETAVIDPLGHRREYTYDALGRVVHQINSLPPAGGCCSTTACATCSGPQGQSAFPIEFITYDAVGNITSTTDRDGNLTSYTYNNLNQQVTSTDALGGVTTTAYDPEGRVTAITDADGHTTQYAYNDRGWLVSKTDAAGGVTSYDYDIAGHLLSSTDALGRITYHTQDSMGRLLTTTDPLGGVWTDTYDVGGNRTSSTDPLGHTTSFTYDNLNRLTSVTDPAGGVEAYTYDAVGDQTAVTDPLGHTTSFTYDALRRLTSSTDPLGHSTAYAFDAVGNETAVTDPLGRTTHSTYDDFNRLLTTTDPAGGITAYTYSRAGDQLTVTDPLGQTTTSAYDALHRVTSQTDPLGHTISFTYDAVNNLTSLTDRNGRYRTFTYDALNRRTSEIWWAGATPVSTIRYGFDAVGNLVSASDPNSSYTMTYDALDRLSSEDNAGTPNLPHVVLNYTYDAVGNTLSVADNLGVSVHATYDPRNLVSSLTWQGVGTAPVDVGFGYDAAGQRTSLDRVVAVVGPVTGVHTTYGYDAAGQLTDLVHTTGGSGVVAAYHYTYDAAGQLVTETHHGQTFTYTYDANGQLTNATSSAEPQESYAYDANGNREGTGLVVGPGNQILSDGSFNYSYDNEGNLARKVEIATGNVTTYTYDYRNRLVSVVTRTAGGVALSTSTYTYDVFNRRIAEVVNGVALYTVYDGNNPWADFDASGNVLARYLVGPKLDEILARWRPSDGVVFYLADHEGTVRDLVSAGAIVIDHIDYTAFGAVLAESNAAVGNRFLFTGREYDAATGLYYYRARYYDPKLGRFISQDPLGFNGGDVNLYRYVKNAPADATDPTGQAAATERAGVTLVVIPITQGSNTAVVIIALNPATQSVLGVVIIPAVEVVTAATAVNAAGASTLAIITTVAVILSLLVAPLAEMQLATNANPNLALYHEAQPNGLSRHEVDSRARRRRRRCPCDGQPVPSDAQLRADVQAIHNSFPNAGDDRPDSGPRGRRTTAVAVLCIRTGPDTGVRRRVYAVSSNRTSEDHRAEGERLGYQRVFGGAFTAPGETHAEQIILNYALLNAHLEECVDTPIAPSRPACGPDRQDCAGRIAGTPGVRLLDPL
jgi:RHS repeat-associated protein